MGNTVFQSTFFQQKYSQIPSQKFQPEYWQHISNQNKQNYQNTHQKNQSHRNLSSKPQYGFYNTYRHYVTGQQIDKYQVICLNKQQYQFYVQSFAWRMRQQFLVNSVFLQQIDKQICSFQRKLNVYIPHIPLRLDDITDIPYPYQITILRNVLLGYQKLYQHVGYFKVRQSQICLDSQGDVKVWINSDLSKNYVQSENFIHIEGLNSQNQMVKQILQIVFYNIDQSSQPYPLSKYIYDKLKLSNTNKLSSLTSTKAHNNTNSNKFHYKKKITFDNALQALENYVEEYKTEIPQSFSKIIQILQNGNHQRLLSNRQSNQQLPTQNRNQHLNLNQNLNNNLRNVISNEMPINHSQTHRKRQSKQSYIQTQKSKQQHQKSNQQIFLKSNKSNKSSMKDLLSQYFSNSSNSPKFKSLESNFFHAMKQHHKRQSSLSSEIPKLQFLQDKVKSNITGGKSNFSKQNSFKMNTNQEKVCESSERGQFIMQTPYHKLRSNSQRQSSKYTNINNNSTPSSKSQIIPIQLITIPSPIKSNNAKRLMRPLMPNPNYVPYPQSIYNPKNTQTQNFIHSQQQSPKEFQLKPTLNLNQTPKYMSNHFSNQFNHPFAFHSIQPPTLANEFPHRMQMLIANKQFRQIHHKNPHQIMFRKNIKNNASLFNNCTQMPSQIAQVSQEKGSSHQRSSVVQVQFSNATSQSQKKQNQKNQSFNEKSHQKDQKISYFFKSEVQQNDPKLKKQNSKSKSDSQKILFQLNRSLKQQKKAKDHQSSNPTQSEQHSNSRYSHPITKNDNDKINDKKSIKSNQMLFSHLLSSNKSDHVEQSKKSKSKNSQKQNQKTTHHQKTQNQIRQSARQQFMVQIQALSQSYKKSLISNENKKGFQYMMESLLSNYDNEIFVVPQSHYSQTKKIPKKVPGALLIHNPTIKEVPSKVSLDPQIMKDLKDYETLEMQQL